MVTYKPRKLAERLLIGSPIILDGAMGTELIRRGVPCTLPLWSAAAMETHPAVVGAIHRSYLEAGAEVLTANTFRTTPRAFRKTGLSSPDARKMARKACRKAVALARGAVGATGWVAGSITTLEDCYSPEFFPGMRVARREYEELAAWMEEDGADVILFETMGRVDEIRAALDGSRETKIPQWVSVCLRDSRRLFGGDDFSDTVHICEERGVQAFLINCSPLVVTRNALRRISESAPIAVGAYPNLGKRRPSPDGTMGEIQSTAVFGKWAEELAEAGARIIGGCCGSTPRHIALLAKKVLAPAP